MKNKILFVLLLVVCFVGILYGQSSTVTLGWSYPSLQATDPTLGFYVWETTNLATPFSNWTQFSFTWASNYLSSANGFNQYQQRTSVNPGAYFFVATSSNFWGQSVTSSVVSTPSGALVVTNTSISRP